MEGDNKPFVIKESDASVVADGSGVDDCVGVLEVAQRPQSDVFAFQKRVAFILECIVFFGAVKVEIGNRHNPFFYEGVKIPQTYRSVGKNRILNPAESVEICINAGGCDNDDVDGLYFLRAVFIQIGD